MPADPFVIFLELVLTFVGVDLGLDQKKPTARAAVRPAEFPERKDVKAALFERELRVRRFNTDQHGRVQPSPPDKYAQEGSQQTVAKTVLFFRIKQPRENLCMGCFQATMLHHAEQADGAA